ncbi:hypothetical protein IIU_01514 [Bacillus cereus VD133]|uniref:Uncharacterized protein n=1 Tax=Bacillus cereus VD133 TaxID=1053233 RepID=A0A9W5V471_BACCE|nr:hypothetical protein IIU_01514 [Bacillus cereus VD133]
MMEESVFSVCITGFLICGLLVAVYALGKPIKEFTKDVE